MVDVQLHLGDVEEITWREWISKDVMMPDWGTVELRVKGARICLYTQTPMMAKRIARVISQSTQVEAQEVVPDVAA